MQSDNLRLLGIAILLALLIGTVSFAQDDQSATPKEESTAQSTVLQNATIHPMDGQPSFVGSVAISDGKIVAVGSEIETPENATVIDLEGCHVIPGLIDCRAKLWLTPAALTEANTKASLNVVDAIDPWSEDWRELAAQGITSVYVQPVSTSFLGGYGAVLRVGPHGSPDDIVLKGEVAVQASIGLTGNTSKDRFTQLSTLEKLIESAKKELDKETKDAGKSEDKAEKTSADSKEEVVEEGGDDKEKTAESEPSRGSTPATSASDDTAKKVLGRVLKKELPLHVEVHHSDALAGVLKLAKKYEIRLVLDGLSQVENCCKELAEAGYPFVVGPLFESGTVPAYRKNADFSWLGKATKSNPLWSLSGFSGNARASRLIRIQAAMAIQHGVEHDQALAAITSNAARMLGVADQIGTLTAGKEADIAVFTGDPLDPSSAARLVMSHGKITFESPATPAKTANAGPFELGQLPAELPSEYVVLTTRLLRNGKFAPGTIHVKDGKVVSANGKEKIDKIPVFDLKDAVVTTGLVAASSSLGQSTAIVDSAESDATHLRSVDAIDPSTEAAKKLLAGGFVHIGVSPGSTNTSAGVVGQVRLGAIEYVADPTIASQFVLANSARSNERYPASLNGQIELLSGLLQGQPSSSAIYVTSTIGRSIQQEKMQNIDELKSGKRQAIIAANSKLEIRSALALVKQHKLSAALLSSGDVGDLAPKLVDQKIGLIVPAVSGDEYQTQLDQVVTANRAGVPIAFAGESPEMIRMTAALLVSAGLPAESALSGLTEGGAKIAGMQKIGFAKNATADFVVWNDSPINLSAKPVHVVVDGQVVSSK